MTYQQTINYLYEQLPMFSKIGPAAYKKDLHNTIALCNALDNPQKKIKSIHIAGTNGKGSTSHMLAAILQQAGYKTGLYTSPHIKDFRERIKINGKMVSEEFIVDFVEKTKELSEKIQPSFFELTVAMAFEYFAQQKVDIAIIETGLGGRLDSTNIITPILSIITNIGWDHMNILGNTLKEIAYEKAGIIKQNVPVVIGEYLPETKSIFEAKAKECNAPIFYAQDLYEANNILTNDNFLTCDIINIENTTIKNFQLDLNGIYQIKNLITVLCAEGILMKQGFNIKLEDEKFALNNVKKLTGFFGRWDIIQQNPIIIVDVAHNEDGIKQILQQLNTFYPQSNLHFVFGFVNDKDIFNMLSLLPRNANYYFTNAHIPRALHHLELKGQAALIGLIGNSFDNVNEALQNAKNKAAKTDVIIICGSFFIISELNDKYLSFRSVSEESRSLTTFGMTIKK